MENKEKELKLSDEELDEVDGGSGLPPRVPLSSIYSCKCEVCDRLFKTEADFKRHKYNGCPNAIYKAIIS